MNPTRRDFIRFVVQGSVLAGCPMDVALLAAPPRPFVQGEESAVCHKVRDGRRFGRPPIGERRDVIIVGGGISGLAAAYYLRDRDFILLEKDSYFGGNAYLQEYEGQAYNTGSAFLTTDEPSVMALARELDLELLPVDQFDGTIVNGRFTPDTWGEGAAHLPYPPAVREGFRKFRRSMLDISIGGREMELDSQPFSDYMREYPPEVKQWWDGFGPSNWGAPSHETSALVGIEAMRWVSPEDRQDVRRAWPGGNGAISGRLVEILKVKYGERMRAGATTVAVEPHKNEVHVTYIVGSELRRAAAKTVVMATPKYITARLVAELPAAQREAMRKIRYAPYAVCNLIFDREVFRGGYDTWCPGSRFTDFVVADWTILNRPGYRPKYNILTCFTPLRENERTLLLGDDACRRLAYQVLRDFQKLMPGFDVDPVEVHFFRRGHPMFMSTPGTYTRVIPAARPPMKRIYFANTDSEGSISTADGAIKQALLAVEWVEKKLKR
jgi:phytoene dehydrogenase-like protein